LRAEARPRLKARGRRLGGDLATLVLALVLTAFCAPVRATSDDSRMVTIRALHTWLSGTGIWRNGTDSVLPGPPPVPPRAMIGPGHDPLAVAVERVSVGDPRGAMNLLVAWQDGSLPEAGKNNGKSKLPPTRFLLGWLELRMGEPGAAADQFSRIRTGNGPLASWATWYEAQAEMARGRYASAARACATYRVNWAEGRYDDDCLLLMGDAWLEAGSWGASQKAFQDFIDLDPESPDVEVARLGQALAAAGSNPAHGTSILKRLALNYLYPTTGATAREALARLAMKGLSTQLPDDIDSLEQAALSARRAKEKEAAWALFTRIRTEAGEDPVAQAWLERESVGFAQRTGHFRELADSLKSTWNTSPSAEGLWDLHESLQRAGAWTEAAAAGEDGLSTYASSQRWRSAEAEVARDQMFAGNYSRAAALWDVAVKEGSFAGQDARWYAAYCTYKAGALDEARKRLDAIVDGDGRRATAARYWRARVSQDEGRVDDARADLDAVRQDDPYSWYSLVSRIREQAQTEAPASRVSGTSLRDGTWAGEPRPALPDIPPVPVAMPPDPMRVRHASTSDLPPDESSRWAAIRWQPGGIVPEPHPGPPGPDAGPARALDTGDTPPSSYVAGLAYDPATARRTLEKAVAKYKDVWPDLEAALLLADAGLYFLSGEIVASCFTEYEDATGEGKTVTPRSQKLDTVDLDTADWRQVFLYTHDHHHTARFLQGFQRYASDPDTRRQVQSLAWPLAFPEALWPAARGADLDPFLLLGLMRQESAYRSWAVSPTGALGLMQVMPSTGALIAHGMGLRRYSPRDLEEPSINIPFGSWYFARLLQRFGGSVPLAVASYNAGPQNVHPWIASRLGNLEVDDFVEQIPVEETRIYVLRVMEYWATYTALYGAPGSEVAFNLLPTKDDPTLVNW
jgi:hypothetical protein